MEPPLYVVNHVDKTITPADREGDDYFGLGPGTNGTAAICRRALVEPEGYRWVRSSGRPATGPNYIPGNTSQESLPGPWDGTLTIEAPEPEPDEDPPPERKPGAFIPEPEEEPVL